MKLFAGLNQRVLFGGFAVVFIAGAVVLAHRWVSQERRRLAEKERQIMSNYQAPIEVVTAAKDLPEGGVMELASLQMTVVPEKFVQPYAVRDPRQVVGQVAKVPIATGEQILLNKLARPNEIPEAERLSQLTPKGKRAVTISVDTLTGVGGFVRPGDLVDLLWTLRVPSPTQKEGEVVTFTIFQDVPILAIGADMLGRAANVRQNPSGEKEPHEYTVTLALTPQEISFLLLAREQGRIQLSLRPRSETGSQALVPANLNTLLDQQFGIKPMSPEPPLSSSAPGAAVVKPTREVEVYKGLTRSIVVLPGSE